MKAKAAIGEVVLRAMLILALVFGLAPLAEAQTLAAKGKPAAAKTKSQASAKSARGMADGQQEGIKVHGHWTIVVRDLDGKEVTRREFENALLPGGQAILGRLLAKQWSVTEWSIELTATPGQLPSTAGVCAGILEPTSPRITPGFSKTLTVNFIPTPHGGGGSFAPGTVELKGDTRAVYGSCDIARVETGISVVFANGMGIGSFTGTDLQPPISVSTGRIIEVTVVLSFS